MAKPLFPYPPHQGTRRVSLALLADLATRHEVRYLCQLEQRAERALIPQVERLRVRVHAPLMPNHISPVHRVLYKIQNRLLARATHTPEVCYYWSNRALRRNLERLSREFAPDLTILESWETFPLRRSIGGGVAVLLAHDAAFRILERAVTVAPDARERAAREQRLRAHKRLEVAAWRLFDAVLTLTEDDRMTIERELGGPPPIVRHLPVPVPVELFAASRPAHPGARVGFLGTFRADFNRDALQFLLREIWPRVRQQLPSAELCIAGNGTAGALRDETLAAGAQWLGFVEDLGAFFASIDLLVVPLRFGGGVRIRILEALAAGVPVVATSVAAAGLATEDGVHVALADGPERIAARIADLLARPVEAAALGARGREWCAAHHGPEVLRPRRLAVIDELLAGGTSTS